MNAALANGSFPPKLAVLVRPIADISGDAHSSGMKEPRSYGPDKALVVVGVLLYGLPIIPSAFLLLKSPTWDAGELSLVALTLPLTQFLFMIRFRATFTSDSLVYRRWGPTITVPYQEIDHIEVTNVTPISKQAIGAFIITRTGDRLPFWPKLFPKDAVNQFFDLSRDVRYPPEASATV